MLPKLSGCPCGVLYIFLGSIAIELAGLEYLLGQLVHLSSFFADPGSLGVVVTRTNRQDFLWPEKQLMLRHGCDVG